ncbi:2A phosphatase associated protein of 46 kD [Actinidia rufa]|uniref:2A phosphatase associated protein of 46 kD n=1 Tax=Actinidia rufa TaxID=165716 RepID=A0A7J0E5P6_9ERIC|nr:2A phosphatase associated protein of 46 kD [Actinidia rufa]
MCPSPGLRIRRPQDVSAFSVRTGSQDPSICSESGVDQETVRKGCEVLRHCEEMISKLGLFSSNETKDDISTTNLKYMLVPYYLAELTEKIAEYDRIQVTKASQTKLKEFISFCEAMELVSEEELQFSAQAGPNSSADQRAKKIARFKRQRAAESKLLEIKERKERRGRSTKATALSAPVESGEEDELDDDGEEEREHGHSSGGNVPVSDTPDTRGTPRRRPWRDCLPPPSHHPWPIGAPARPVEGHRAKRKPFEVKSTLIGVESSLVRSVSKQISHSHSPHRRLTVGSAFPTRSGRVSDEIGASFRRASEKEAPIRGSQGDSPPLCKIPATKGRRCKFRAMISIIGTWLTTISLAICKAFDLLEMLKKEEEMLSAIKEKQLQEGGKEISQVLLDDRTKRAEAWHRDAATRAQYTRPAQPITCATFAQDVIEGRAKASQVHEHKHQPLIFGPASLVGGNPSSERERMAAQVFQPSYRLPTMSIEEAGLREMEMMNNFQERNAKLMEEANSSWYKDNPKSRPGEEDEDDDAAEEKARAWDDWKDDNPRGAGNKKLTPCG